MSVNEMPSGEEVPEQPSYVPPPFAPSPEQQYAPQGYAPQDAFGGQSTPALTPASIAAYAITGATNVVLLFGIDISQAKQAAMLASVNALAVIGTFAHDFGVRRARNKTLQTAHLVEAAKVAAVE